MIVDIHTGQEIVHIENDSWWTRNKKIIGKWCAAIVGYTIANALIGQAFDMDALHTFYLVIGYMIATTTYNTFIK